MGEFVAITAKDGFTLSAYEAKPTGKVRGGLVVIQEIFGVNAHIRSVADGYAEKGYHVLSPAIFDRAEKHIDLGYDKADIDRGIALRAKIPVEATLLDVAASVKALQASGKVGIVGYCYGGSLAWLAACQLAGLSAAIGYYGGLIVPHLGEKPRCPVMLHFGEKDGGIPMTDVEKIRSATDPKLVQVFAYAEAGHAFNRDGNQAFHAPSAKLARERTLAFLGQHVG
jgi:carboxymethylenebutenolidase